MDERQALESHTPASVIVEPADGSLDHPAGFTQTTAVRRVAPGDLGLDALGVKGPAVLVVIVATVGLDDPRLGERSPPFSTDGWNGFDEGQKLDHIVAIGTGQDDGQRNALRFGDQVVLGAGACAIGGIGSCF